MGTIIKIEKTNLTRRKKNVYRRTFFEGKCFWENEDYFAQGTDDNGSRSSEVKASCLLSRGGISIIRLNNFAITNKKS